MGTVMNIAIRWNVAAPRGVLVGIAAAAMIASAAGCGTSPTAHQITSTSASASASATKPTSVAAQGQSACTELNGTTGQDQSCHVHSATSGYKIDMTFSLDYPDMPAVTDFLKRDRDEFLDWVAKFGSSGSRRRPYQYVVTATNFRSGTPQSGTQSLVLRIDNDTGLAHEGHPNTTFQAFNYDVGKRGPITFDTLFKPGTKPLEILDPIVRRELHAPTADLNEKTYQNFAITSEAVIFFFDQDEVVPDNAGPHKVTVPRGELASVLA
jgi:hypothetical protein